MWAKGETWVRQALYCGPFSSGLPWHGLGASKGEPIAVWPRAPVVPLWACTLSCVTHLCWRGLSVSLARTKVLWVVSWAPNRRLQRAEESRCALLGTAAVEALWPEMCPAWLPSPCVLCPLMPCSSWAVVLASAASLLALCLLLHSAPSRAWKEVEAMRRLGGLCHVSGVLHGFFSLSADALA